VSDSSLVTRVSRSAKPYKHGRMEFWVAQDHAANHCLQRTTQTIECAPRLRIKHHFDANGIAHTVASSWINKIRYASVRCADDTVARKVMQGQDFHLVYSCPLPTSDTTMPMPLHRSIRPLPLSCKFCRHSNILHPSASSPSQCAPSPSSLSLALARSAPF
jgi:hypothetical protein